MRVPLSRACRVRLQRGIQLKGRADVPGGASVWYPPCCGAHETRITCGMGRENCKSLSKWRACSPAVAIIRAGPWRLDAKALQLHAFDGTRRRSTGHAQSLLFVSDCLVARWIDGQRERDTPLSAGGPLQGSSLVFTLGSRRASRRP